MVDRSDVRVDRHGGAHLLRGRPMHTEVAKIMELIKTRGQGALILYEELAQIIGHNQRETRFRSVMTRARRDVLRELGFCLRARMNVGYDILTASEQVVEGTRCARGAIRRMHKSAGIVQVADRSQLSPAESKSADFIATRLTTMCSDLRREVPMLAKVAQVKTLPWSHARDNGEGHA